MSNCIPTSVFCERKSHAMQALCTQLAHEAESTNSELELDLCLQLLRKRAAIHYAIDKLVQSLKFEWTVVQFVLLPLGPKSKELILAVEVITEPEAVQDIQVHIRIDPNGLDWVPAILLGKLNQSLLQSFVFPRLQPDEAELGVNRRAHPITVQIVCP